MKTEIEYCEICSRPKAQDPREWEEPLCCCKGIQPYAMSQYPGEHELVPIHPANGGDQWYKRSEVDAKLDELEKRMTAQPNDALTEGGPVSVDCNSKPNPPFGAANG